MGALIPMIPMVLEFIMGVVNSVKTAPGTSAEQKAKLDAISESLKQVAIDVQAVQLPDKN